MQCAEVTGVGQPLKVTQRPIPTIPDHGALVRIRYGGMCHSDVHHIFELGAGQVEHHSEALGDKYIGMVPGHEIAGVIEAFGAKVNIQNLDLKIGDKVAVYPWVGCQICSFCKAGYNNECQDNNQGITDIGLGIIPGGYGTHTDVPDVKFLVKLPENIPLDLACLLPCSAITAYHALTKARPALQHVAELEKTKPARLMLIGAGGLGLWALKLARLVIKDVNLSIVVADINQEKLDLVKANGADETILLHKGEDVMATVNRITNGGRDGMGAAIDFFASPQTTGVALGSLRRGGTVVWVGLADGILPIQIRKVVRGNINIHGIRTAPPFMLKEIVTLLSSNPLKYPALEQCELKDINAALEKLKAGKAKGRIVINHNM